MKSMVFCSYNLRALILARLPLYPGQDQAQSRCSMNTRWLGGWVGGWVGGTKGGRASQRTIKEKKANSPLPYEMDDLGNVESENQLPASVTNAAGISNAFP